MLHRWSRITAIAIGLAQGAAVVPAAAITRTWTGGAGTTSWHDAANWDPVGVPTADDDVILGGNLNDVVVVSSGINVVQSLVCNQTLRLQGDGTLITNTLGTINGLFEIDTSGGYGSGGDFIVDGTVDVTEGSFGATRLVTTSTGSVHLGAATTVCQFDEIQNSGTITWTSGLVVSTTILNDGLFVADTAGTLMMYSSAAGAAFQNNGEFRKTGAGTVTTGILLAPLPFNNSGTFLVQAGTMVLATGGTNAGVTTISAGATLTHDGTNVTDSSSQTNVNGTLRVTSGTFTANGAVTVTGSLIAQGNSTITNLFGPLNADFGTIDFQGTLDYGNLDRTVHTIWVRGTLRGNGNLSVATAATWTAGTMFGPGQFIIQPSSTFTMSSSTKTARRTIVNHGTMTWTLGDLRLPSDGTVENHGTFLINNTNSVFCENLSGTAGRFDNYGLVRKIGSFGATFRAQSPVSVSFNNEGTCQIEGGSLNIGGGSHTGEFLCLAGTLLLNGTHTLSSDSSIEATGILHLGGAITCDAPIEANGEFRVSGAGPIFLNNSVLVNSTLRVASANSDPGVVEFLGPTSFHPHASIIYEDNSSLVFYNPITVDTLYLASGDLAGPADVTVTGAFTLYGGSMSGTGRTIIGADATTATLISGGTLRLGRVLENHAAMTIVVGTFGFSNGVLENHGHITVTPAPSTSDVFLRWDSGTATLLNLGTLTKSGTGDLTIESGVSLINEGVLACSQGETILSGGGVNHAAFNVAAGATLRLASSFTHEPTSLISGTGNLLFTGGTHDLPSGTLAPTGFVDFDVGNIFVNNPITPSSLGFISANVTFNAPQSFPSLTVVAGGILTGSADVTLTGSLTWSGGTMSGSGSTILNPGATCAVNGANPKTLSRTLVNDGTMTWSSTGALTMNNGHLINNASFIANHSGSVGTNGTGGTNRFTNNSTFTKQGTGATTFTAGSSGVLFRNFGTVNVTAGSLLLRSGVEQLIGTKLDGGIWSVLANSTLGLPTGASIQSLASGTVVQLNGSGSQCDGITLLEEIDSGCSFELLGGRDLVVAPPSGTLMNNGSLVLGPSSDLDVTGTLVNGPAAAVNVTLQSIADSPIRSSASMSLNGTLIVQFAAGFGIGPGQNVQILRWTSGVFGTFAALIHPLTPACLLTLTFDATTATLGLDAIPPIALCQDIDVQLNASGNATINAAMIDNGSSDNCAIALMSIDRTSFTCADVGPNLVMLTVTDVAGTIATCPATVTVLANGTYQGAPGGSWFVPSHWCDGVPDQQTDVALSTLVHVDQPGAEARYLEILNGGELRVGSPSGASLHVLETIGVANGGTLSIVENGSVMADMLIVHAGGTLRMNADSSALLNVKNLVLNEGAILDWSAGIIEIVNGTWVMGANNSLVQIGCGLHTMALRLLEGGVVITQTIDLCDLGALEGNGTAIASVNNGGAVVPGTSPGMLSISGDFGQTSDGTLVIEIGGLAPESEHDVLAVSGTALLNGTLTVALINGFDPVQGNQFEILSASGITNRFIAYNLPALAGALVWRVVYDDTVITLRAQRPADVTNDGSVSTEDLLTVINGWGTCPPGCAGDVFPMPGGDGLVNTQDLLLVINNWG